MAGWETRNGVQGRGARRQWDAFGRGHLLHADAVRHPAKRVMVRQPGGKPVEHVEFRYHAKGDQALLAFLNPSPSASPDEGYLVRAHAPYRYGGKDGEWENLFCTT